MSLMPLLRSRSAEQLSEANLRRRRKYSTTGKAHAMLIAAAEETGLTIGDVLETLILEGLPASLAPPEVVVEPEPEVEPPSAEDAQQRLLDDLKHI